MARKTTDIRELAQALNAPAFGNRNAEELPTELDPVSPTTLVLSLSDIKPYEHNPRRAENPEFDRLKDSIASRRGLTTPLTVTKRPGDQRHTIAAGGNSRLQVLNELYTETGDQAFNRVMCQFEPWDSDCQVLANHLIENDVRGNITFADKARAIVHWCELYEATHADEVPLTQRELAERLGHSGFQVSQTSLSRFLYAVEQLLPWLPKAFESGMGREPIERLIRLRTLTEQYWHDTLQVTGLKPESSFEAVFAEVCAAQDCHREDWAHELFASALAYQVAEALGAEVKLVTLDLDNLYRGVPVNITAPASGDTAGNASADGWVFERERRHLAEQAERQQARAEARAQRQAVPCQSAPTRIPVIPEQDLVVKALFCRDPDGYHVELGCYPPLEE